MFSLGHKTDIKTHYLFLYYLPLILIYISGTAMFVSAFTKTEIKLKLRIIEFHNQFLCFERGNLFLASNCCCLWWSCHSRWASSWLGIHHDDDDDTDDDDDDDDGGRDYWPIDLLSNLFWIGCITPISTGHIVVMMMLVMMIMMNLVMMLMMMTRCTPTSTGQTRGQTQSQFATSLEWAGRFSSL